jgi:formate dehydrogenase maturation protein FdhE
MNETKYDVVKVKCPCCGKRVDISVIELDELLDVYCEKCNGELDVKFTTKIVSNVFVQV